MGSVDRSLVINADDFGYDPASTELVLSLIAEGRLSSTTVLTVADDLSDDLTAELNRLAGQGKCAVSLHFATTSEHNRQGWRPRSDAGRRLADPNGLLPISSAVAERRADSEIIDDELEAQLERAVELGLHPTRLDSHCGTLYGLRNRSTPGPMEIAVDFCQRHHLGLRLPRSTRLLVGPYLPTPLRNIQGKAMARADEAAVRLPVESTSNPFPRPLIPSYAALRAQYLWLLPRLPEGTSEIFLHPGAESTWAKRHFGRSWDKRVWEARLLCDPVWLDALAAQQIRLVTTW
jgi:predicted glycoside hydrolase/deacetylase ChbG (UPF0249 family)